MIKNKYSKVCHLTSVHSPFDVRIFYKECKSLLKAGYDVVLIAQHERDETVDGIKIKALPKVKSRLERMVRLPLIILKKALEEGADVYHFHDPELIPVGLILKLYRKKVIYDIHEDYKSKILSKSYITPPLRKIISTLFDLFEKQSSKCFDALITADNYVKSRFRYGNVYRVANFPPLLDIRKIQRNDGKVICVYSGGLSEDRGIAKIVGALQYLKDIPVEVILLGEWENEYIKNYALRNSEVKYLGYKTWDEVMKTLAMADIGLNLLQPVPAYLYAAENSVKIFEYMMVRLPVVSSNFEGLKNIIEENKCGITVDPSSSKEIAEAIRYLFEHPEEAKKMGENGRRAVEEKYNWENESKKLIKVYETLLFWNKS